MTIIACTHYSVIDCIAFANGSFFYMSACLGSVCLLLRWFFYFQVLLSFCLFVCFILLLIRLRVL